MKIDKAVSIPLVTHDPFFSIWSSADKLYEATPTHWCGANQTLKGVITIDGKRYIFLGKDGMMQHLNQCHINLTATATEYVFENDAVRLTCRFTSPLLLDDMVLVSRPCTYVDFAVEKKNAQNVIIDFSVGADVVRRGHDPLVGFEGTREDYHYSYMGRAIQQPLSGSDDGVAIDWGYAYVASPEEQTKCWYVKNKERLHVQIDLSQRDSASFVFAYDDLLSINYFGQWRKAYWTNTYATILDAIGAAIADKAETLQKAARLDEEMERKAYEIGGESYAYLCNLSYRQAIAAHKLITDDEGNVLFLSKENASNGCIGTVDVSYPSVPLFMLYDPEYVKGMMRPIFQFAACDVWEYDYAPHDVGRYPYAWGQVYAYKENFGSEATELKLWESGRSGVFPPFYMYPAGSGIYNDRYQMPVEECGNMLIMVAAVCKADQNAEFAKPHWEVLKRWKNYLVTYGSDPGDQLCTDDFAGHLEHNVNLSVKAIMGIEAYASLAEMLGEDEEARKHHKLAKDMAADWEARAYAGDHYALAFGKPDTWSLKYNLVWDKIWGSNLFSQEVYQKELAYYLEKNMEYGVPLDNRDYYAKSDWILWCAAMAENREQAEQLIKPVAHYAKNSPSRVPFADWYQANEGINCMFIARTVQGGIFMPMLLH